VPTIWLRTVVLESVIAAAASAAPCLDGLLALASTQEMQDCSCEKVNGGMVGIGRGWDVRVTTSNDLGLGALCVCERQQTSHFGNRRSGCTAWLQVSGQGGAVGAADALDPDVGGAIVGFESVAEGDAESALYFSY
jgi:hypothetical protein